MQLFMNLQMRRLLEGRAQISVLRKSEKYLSKKQKTLDDLLENDPCSDADVRFFGLGLKGEQRPPRISLHSILRLKRDETLPVQLILVGTYQHICICIVNHDAKAIEFFDSRGGNGELLQIRSFFKKEFPGFRFLIVNKKFDIQASKKEEHVNAIEEGAELNGASPNEIIDDKAPDVYCHTWIYLYAYRRLVKHETQKHIMQTLSERSAPDRLAYVESFQGWMYELNAGSKSDTPLTTAMRNGFVAPSGFRRRIEQSALLTLQPRKRKRSRKAAEAATALIASPVESKRRIIGKQTDANAPCIDRPRGSSGRWVDHGTAVQQCVPPRVYQQLKAPKNAKGRKEMLVAGTIVAHRWTTPKGWFIGRLLKKAAKGVNKGSYVVSYGKSARYGGSACHGLLPKEYGPKGNWVLLELRSGKPAVF